MIAHVKFTQTSWMAILVGREAIPEGHRFFLLFLQYLRGIKVNMNSTENWVKEVGYERAGYWLCVLVLWALLIFRYHNLYTLFFLRYTDIDQLVMWVSAVEMADFHFWEPRFYSQQYNSMLEGLLAAPGIRMGLSPEEWLPLVSIGLNLTPLIAFTWLGYSLKNTKGLILILLFYNLLPNQYFMITGLSRGFVTGMLPLALLLLGLVMKKSKFNISLLTFILLAGIWLNPNTLLAGIPIYIYLMLERKIRMPEIPWLVYGAIPVIVMGLWEKYFYFSNPEISIFRNSDFHFSVSNFFRGIQHLDVYFNYLMPTGGSVLFLIIIFIYIYIYI